MIKNIKNMCILMLILMYWREAGAQTIQRITIDSCYVLAERNYPLVKQYALIEKTKGYSIDNASRGNLPQLNIAGQATYQSDVTQIPFKLPNIDIPTIDRDQYKLYGEISQPITDLFTIKYQKELISANASVEAQKISVELYKIRERINQLYFGILLIDAQQEQTEILKKDIQSGINKANAAIANGIALKSSADVLKAELLKANQRTIELKANRNGYAGMLSLFINQNIDGSTILEKPGSPSIIPAINRPEMKLFDLQQKTFDAQKLLVNVKTLPRFSVFLQGGYGRPALNMLKNDFDFYYIGGLRLNWNLTSFYTYKKEKQLLSLNQGSFDIQKETFLLNTNITLKQQNTEITKLEELIEADNDIIRLRTNIRITAQSQLEYGTATTNDYLSYLNAESQAKQNLLLHQIQLLMAQYNYQTTSGN